MDAQNNSNVAAMNVNADMQFSPNMVSAFSYVCPLVGIVALNAKPYSSHSNIRFHAWQSILYSVAATIGYTVLSIVTAILGLILGMVFGALKLYTVVALGAQLMSLGFALLGLTLFLAWAFLVFQASQGKRFMIPLIGKHAERLASQG